MPAPAPAPLTCVTWNLHRGFGPRRRPGAAPDPAPILRALIAEIAPLRPDVLALQEADEERPPYLGFLDMSAIEQATGLIHAQSDPRLRWAPDSRGFHGNILMLSPRLSVTASMLVDLPGVYPRGAVVVETLWAGLPIRLVTLHLSLSQVLRVAQLRTLGQLIARRPRMQSVLLGDMNEWRPWGGLALSPRVTGLRLSGTARPTFPVATPVLPLDRILSDGPVTESRVLNGPLLRRASDHAALSARVQVYDPAADRDLSSMGNIRDSTPSRLTTP